MLRLVFILLSIYLFIRGCQALPKMLILRIIYSVLFWFATASLYSGYFLSDLFPANVKITLRQIGGFWAVCFAISLLAVLFADFMRLLDRLTGLFPDWISHNPARVKHVYFTVVTVISLLVALLGFRKYADTQTVSLTLPLHKHFNDSDSLSIVAASDFHLGNLIDKERLAGWVSMINAQDPDIVLLVGDLFDRSFNKDLSQELTSEFKKLKATYGIYAVLGNHEYYTDTKEAINCLERSGIKLLVDEAITVGSKVVIIGRDDYTNDKRKPLDSLLTGINKNMPLILMDHQPVHLKEAVKQNIDLQISGHLHNGQVYPLNHLFKGNWELFYGYRKTGNTHFFVSSGLGLRRIPFRLGSQSEIVSIKLKGQ